MELNNKIRKKKRSFRFGSFKILFCVCEKWSVILVISKFFLPTNVLKRSAIADDRPLFATLSPPSPNYLHEPVKFSIFLKFFFCLFDSKKTFAIELATNCINLKCKFFSMFSTVVKYV